jgi:hypothetical protein
VNSVRFVFPYPDLAAYEAEETAVARDAEYAEVAIKLLFTPVAARAARALTRL